MALDLTPEQKEIGKANFQRAVSRYGMNRRDFMKGMLAAGAVLPVSAAMYYGYQRLAGNPVKVGLIGAGDEGGVLVGEHNPEYLEVVAYSDIRPSNQKRIFEGEQKKNPNSPRKGFNKVYGTETAKKIQLYENYRDLLARKDIEAVIIALPLHLHAPVAIDAMKAGKHVLCEKLMARTIGDCKKMIQVADDNKKILSIGHQRHYSLLYAHASEVIGTGDLGTIRHIRAQWHRNNAIPLRNDDGSVKIDPQTGKPFYKDGWHPEIKEEDRKALTAERLKALGYPDIEHLVRWRLYNATGGGLMAELGSHQLDACSIFLGKVHPLAVQGFGAKTFYEDDRECDDHVFVTYEFPGKSYVPRKGGRAKNGKETEDIVVVTYSSISTNAFEPYGECVMGTNGTMVVEKEESVMLYPEKGGMGTGRSLSVTVTTTGDGKTALDASSSTGGPAEVKKDAERGQAALGEKISRGYREEMEHFAYCVRMWNQGMEKDRPLPRCHGRVAMADAIIALTANRAMQEGRRIVFEPEWFDAASPRVPDEQKAMARL
jgi:predicted dehydrogenase